MMGIQQGLANPISDFNRAVRPFHRPNSNLIWHVKKHNMSCLHSDIVTNQDPVLLSACQSVFNSILAGKYKEMLWRAKGCENSDHVMGNCSFMFTHPWMGTLAECSCDSFSRMDQPNLRRGYENRVIDKVLTMVYNQLREANTSKEIKVSIFASGDLFGEFSLMVRLFSELQKQYLMWDGKICLNLIDLRYTSNEGQVLSSLKTIGQIKKEIQSLKSSQKKSALGLVILSVIAVVVGGIGTAEGLRRKDKAMTGVSAVVALGGVSGAVYIASKFAEMGRQIRELKAQKKALLSTAYQVSNLSVPSVKSSHAMETFIRWMEVSKPANIRLEVNFYADANSYGRLCQKDTSLKNHLLIGSDIDDAISVVDKLSRDVLIDQRDRVILKHSGLEG
ncbi:hypothetical protein [Parachlamydia acanthamoebae]|jgi:hypothetical protein|uniref:hypothetical protein n=1 Tax=Parachlamydia acanthamoebae TaxID=83552 RepID=UPI0024E25F6F|nr:hypothetical protein [Parachlamydia acanthamoebae]